MVKGAILSFSSHPQLCWDQGGSRAWGWGHLSLDGEEAQGWVGVGMLVSDDAEQFSKVLSPIRFNPRLPMPRRSWDDRPGSMALKRGSTHLGAPRALPGSVRVKPSHKTAKTACAFFTVAPTGEQVLASLHEPHSGTQWHRDGCVLYLRHSQ